MNLILPIYDILEKNKKNWYDNHKMLRVVNSKLEFQPSVVQAGFVGYIYIENQEKDLILRDKVTFEQSDEFEVYDVSKGEIVNQIDLSLPHSGSHLSLIISKSLKTSVPLDFQFHPKVFKSILDGKDDSKVVEYIKTSTSTKVTQL